MQNKSILIGEPRNYPKVLVHALSELFKQHPEIKKAYLAQIFDPSSGEPPHITVGIMMNAQIESIAYDLHKIVETHCTINEFVDFIPINLPNTVELFSSIEPFYVSS